MRKLNKCRVLWFTIFPLLCAILAPTTVVEAAVSLNNISLDFNFQQVMTTLKGGPHYIGPVAGDPADVANILSIPTLPKQYQVANTIQNPVYNPTPTVTAAGIDIANPYTAAMRAGLSFPWMIPNKHEPASANTNNAPTEHYNPVPLGNPNAPTGHYNPVPLGNPNGSGGIIPGVDIGPQKVDKLKGRSDYMVWMYEGNKPNVPDVSAGFDTYIILNRATGGVVAVVLWSHVPGKVIKGLQTPNNINLGNFMVNVLDTYGNPEGAVKIVDNLFVLSYPEKNVTYSIDSATRRVIGIAIGDKAWTALVDNSSRKPPTTNQAAPPRPTLTARPTALPAGGTYTPPRVNTPPTPIAPPPPPSGAYIPGSGQLPSANGPEM